MRPQPHHVVIPAGGQVRHRRHLGGGRRHLIEAPLQRIRLMEAPLRIALHHCGATKFVDICQARATSDRPAGQQQERRRAHRLAMSAASSFVCTQKVMSVQGLSPMGVLAMYLRREAGSWTSVTERLHCYLRGGAFCIVIRMQWKSPALVRKSRTEVGGRPRLRCASVRAQIPAEAEMSQQQAHICCSPFGLLLTERWSAREL